jgi:hypothetical protein
LLSRDADGIENRKAIVGGAQRRMGKQRWTGEKERMDWTGQGRTEGERRIRERMATKRREWGRPAASPSAATIIASQMGSPERECQACRRAKPGKSALTGVGDSNNSVQCGFLHEHPSHTGRGWCCEHLHSGPPWCSCGSVTVRLCVTVTVWQNSMGSTVHPRVTFVAFHSATCAHLCILRQEVLCLYSVYPPFSALYIPSTHLLLQMRHFPCSTSLAALGFSSTLTVLLTHTRRVKNTFARYGS